MSVLVSGDVRVLIEENGGVIVRVPSETTIIPVKSGSVTVNVESHEKTILNRNLWEQWTQQLPTIFQSAVDAIGLSGRAYSDSLANALTAQMGIMETGIHNSLDISLSSVAQQMMQIVNAHDSLAGVVETKITQADADSAIAIAIDMVAAQVGDNVALNYTSKTAFSDAMMAKSSEIAMAKSEVLESTATYYVEKTTYAIDKIATTTEINTAKSDVLGNVALNYVEKTTYATDQSAMAAQISGVSASVVDAEARIVQSYTVYVDENLSYDVKVYSSNGSIFRNGIISTTLTTKINKGNMDVTADITPASFSWLRISNDLDGDTQWNLAHAGIGNTVTITSSDVYGKAVFRCLVNI